MKFAVRSADRINMEANTLEISQVVCRLDTDILPDFKRLFENTVAGELLLDAAGASKLNVETVIDQAGKALSELAQPVQIVVRCSYDEVFANWVGQVRHVCEVPVIVRADMSDVEAFGIDECNRLEVVRTHLARSRVRLELVNRNHNPQIIVSLFVAGHLRNYVPKPLPKSLKGSWEPYLPFEC